VLGDLQAGKNEQRRLRIGDPQRRARLPSVVARNHIIRYTSRPARSGMLLV